MWWFTVSVYSCHFINTHNPEWDWSYALTGKKLHFYLVLNSGYSFYAVEYKFLSGWSMTGSIIYVGRSESKERFAMQRYLLIIWKKQNMQVLSHTFTYFST